MPALPAEALLGVVRRPDVERRQRVDRTPVRDREMRRDLGPGPDPDTIGLGDLVVVEQRVRRRLAVAPHTLLERPRQLWLVGLTDEIGALVVERGVQEEPLVIELEVFFRLVDTALTER